MLSGQVVLDNLGNYFFPRKYRSFKSVVEDILLPIKWVINSTLLTKTSMFPRTATKTSITHDFAANNSTIRKITTKSNTIRKLAAKTSTSRHRDNLRYKM